MSNLNKTLSIKYNLNKTSSFKYNLTKTSSIKYSLDKKSSNKFNLNKTSSIKNDFQRASSMQQGFEKSVSSKGCFGRNSKSNLDNCSHDIKCISEKEEFEEKEKDDDNSSSSNSDDNKKSKIKQKENKSYKKSKFSKKEMHFSSDSDKNNIIDNLKISSLSSDKNEVSNKSSNINEMNDLTPFKKEEINDEIYNNEIFNISKKEENLFSRKIKLSNILNQLQNSPNKLIPNNHKVHFLLEYDKDHSSFNQNNINHIQIINNNIENLNTNFNMSAETNEIKISTKNCCFCECHLKNVNSPLSKEKTTSIYSIIKIADIEYKSLYENLNQMTNYKYSSNIELQDKVKNTVTESLLFMSFTSNKNTLVKKIL